MIGSRTAAIALLIALGGLFVFHAFMLAGLLPADMAWGGRTGGSERDLIVLETIGLVVTALFGAIVAVKAGFMGRTRRGRVVDVAMWIVCAYFTLNILGNATSGSARERAIFTPVSVVLALLALRLALTKRRDDDR